MYTTHFIQTIYIIINIIIVYYLIRGKVRTSIGHKVYLYSFICIGTYFKCI